MLLFDVDQHDAGEIGVLNGDAAAPADSHTFKVTPWMDWGSPFYASSLLSASLRRSLTSARSTKCMAETFTTETKPASDGALIANSGWGGLLPTATNVGVAIPLHTSFLAARSG